MKSSLDVDALRVDMDDAFLKAHDTDDPITYLANHILFDRSCLEKYLSSATTKMQVSDDDLQIEFICAECPVVNEKKDLIDDTVNKLEKYGMPHMDTGYAKFNVTFLPTGDVATEEQVLFNLKGRWYVYDPGDGITI